MLGIMNKLLESIQQDAVSDSCSLGQVLRKLRVLAGKLDIVEIEEWIHKEANGYDKSEPIPNYRQWAIELKGNFSGYAGSGLKNAPIPKRCIPDKHRAKFDTYKCYQSVASLEQTILARKDGDLGPVNVQLQAELAEVLGMGVFEGYNCIQVWGEFAVGNVHELMNEVRNKVLEFVTELIKKYPSNDMDGVGSGEDATQEVKNIFNTTITNSTVGNVGGSNNTSTISFNTGDVQSLEHELDKIGIDKDLIEELKTLVQDGSQRVVDGVLPSGVGSWLGKCVSRMATGTMALSAAATTPLLTKILGQYFGIDV